MYRATDTNLQRQVAIKVLPDAVAADPERLARFDREAKTLAALNHPNIAHIYGLEKSGSTTALVMELVEGPTLADRIGTRGSSPGTRDVGRRAFRSTRRSTSRVKSRKGSKRPTSRASSTAI